MSWGEEYCVHIFLVSFSTLQLSCVVTDSVSDTGSPIEEKKAKIYEISNKGKYHFCLEKQLSSEALPHVAVLGSASANFNFVMIL